MQPNTPHREMVATMVRLIDAKMAKVQELQAEIKADTRKLDDLLAARQAGGTFPPITPAAPLVQIVAEGTSLRAKILALINGTPGKTYTAMTLAVTIGVPHQIDSIRSIAARMAQDGTISKTSPGVFTACQREAAASAPAVAPSHPADDAAQVDLCKRIRAKLAAAPSRTHSLGVLITVLEEDGDHVGEDTIRQALARMIAEGRVLQTEPAVFKLKMPRLPV